MTNIKGVRHVARFVHRGARVLALVVGLFGLGLTQAYAYAVKVPVKGYTPPVAPNTPGGTYTVPGSRAANDSRYHSPNGPAANDAIFDANGVARTGGRVEIGGVITEVVANVAIGATATRVISAACFGHVLGAIACAGAGMAAWYAASNIRADGEDWVVDDLRSEFGPCYTWKNPITAALSPCAFSVGAAVDGFRSWANSSNYQDGSNATQSWDKQFENAILPLPSLNPGQSANAKVATHQINTNKSTGNQTHFYGDTTVSIKRDIDQEVLTPETRPATEGDFDDHAEANPVPAAAANESPVPVPVESPAYEPATVPVGEPIPGSTPEDGWEQDVVKLAPNPSPEPQDMTATPGTQKADNPETPEDEGAGEEMEETEKDPCAISPGTLMCEELGEPPADEVPETSFDLAWNAEPLGLPAACPAPIPMGAAGQLEFTSVCEGAAAVSPFIVAMGAICAAGIMLAAVRGS